MSASPISNRPLTAAPQASTTLQSVQRIMVGTDGTIRSVLSPDMLMSDMKSGIIMGLPQQLLADNTDYRSHKLGASKFMADVISQSLGFGVWTIASAVCAVALGSLGVTSVFVTGAVGMAGGMIGMELFNRTFGAALTKVLPEKLSDAKAKPIMDFVSKWSGANLFMDWVWHPFKNHIWTPLIMGHKILSAVVLGVLALRFPFAAKFVGSQIGMMAIGMGGAIGFNSFILNRFLKPAPDLVPNAVDAVPAGDDDAKAMVIIEGAYQTAVQKFKDQGATPAEADTAAQKWLTETMVKNGAKQAEADALVKAAVEVVKSGKAPAPAPAAPSKPATMAELMQAYGVDDKTLAMIWSHYQTAYQAALAKPNVTPAQADLAAKKAVAAVAVDPGSDPADALKAVSQMIDGVQADKALKDRLSAGPAAANKPVAPAAAAPKPAPAKSA